MLSRLARVPALRAFPAARAFSGARPVLSDKLADVKTPGDLFGTGAQPNTVPTSLEQATGLERLELLGKLEGVEIFETEPLDASRTGTMADPIVIDLFDEYRYIGCTGSPGGSHVVQWLKPRKDKVARCWECGSVYKLNYLGTGEAHHH